MTSAPCCPAGRTSNVPSPPTSAPPLVITTFSAATGMPMSTVFSIRPDRAKSVEPDRLTGIAVIVGHVDVIGSGRHLYVIARPALCDHVAVVLAGRAHLDSHVPRGVIAIRHSNFQVGVSSGCGPPGKTTQQQQGQSARV